MAETQKLQLVKDDCIPLIVNSSIPIGRGNHKSVSFDALCERLTVAETEAASAAVARGDRGASVDFAKRILVSFTGLKSHDGVEYDCELPEVMESFFVTWPLPMDLAAAYFEAIVDKKDKKLSAGKLTANGRSSKNS